MEINMNGLYQIKDPWAYTCDKDKSYQMMYWARNWTFTPKKLDDGTIIMIDTYFHNKEITVTPENEHFFEFVFDFDDVNICQEHTYEEYDDCDRFIAATDSGGWYGKNTHWIKKGAVPSKKKMTDIVEDNIKRLESELEFAKKELAMLQDGSHWKLRQKQ